MSDFMMAVLSSQLGIPATPTGLSSDVIGPTNIVMIWNTSIGATGYKLYRATTIGGSYTLIYTGASATFNDTGLSLGTTYYYKVSATNALGESALSTAVAASTLAYYVHSISTTSTTTQSLSCSQTGSQTVYMNVPFPDIGDNVYTNTGLTTTFNGSSTWWLLADTGCRITTSGAIIATNPCA